MTSLTLLSSPKDCGIIHMWRTQDELFGASCRLLIKSNQVAWGNWTCYPAGVLFFNCSHCFLLCFYFVLLLAGQLVVLGLSWIFTPTPPQQHVRQTQTHSRLLLVWVCRGFKVWALPTHRCTENWLLMRKRINDKVLRQKLIMFERVKRQRCCDWVILLHA